jgi:twinkle protein
MGKCIIKISHKTDKCDSGDGLQVFEAEDGSLNGFCFACGKVVDDPLGEGKTKEDIPEDQRRKEKTQEEIDAELKSIAKLRCLELPTRHLWAESLNKFGIRVGVSEEDGKTPTYAYFPYRRDGKVFTAKVVILQKKYMWFIGPAKGVEPFGWKEAVKSGAKRLIITEGEWDAVALTQIFDKYQPAKYKEYAPAIISVPFGAGNAHKYLGKWKQDISRHFDEVALCFDNDEAGREAVANIGKIWPGIKDIILPEKDANKCLVQGCGKAAFKAAQFQVNKLRNSKIRIVDASFHEETRKPPEWGRLTWPCQHLNEATRNLRTGETIYGGAGVKMGKTTWRNNMGAHFIHNDGVKVFIAAPEEANQKTYRMMASSVVGKVFHDPKIPFDEKEYDKAGEMLREHLALLDIYQHLGWDTLKDDIYASADWGAKVAFIDPITNLTDHLPASGANEALQMIAQDLSVMALDLDMLMVIMCHLKAHEGHLSPDAREKLYGKGKYIGLGNCDHEMGGSVYSNQFAGSRAMMRKCNLMFGLEGNKDPTLPEEIRNLRNINILEAREFDSGIFPIYFNSNTWKYEEAV